MIIKYGSSVLFALIQQHLQAIVTVLALVNPLVCGALFAVAVAVLLMWIVLLLAARMGGGRPSDGDFARDTMTRFMGLIVIAMGIQFALTGLRACMMASQ